MLGEKERPGAALVWGSADHKAMETNFVQKIETGEDLSVQDVELAFAECFDERIDEFGGESEIDWGQSKSAEIKDRGVKLVASYHVQVSPTIQPIAVEEMISLEIPGVSVPIIGYLDVTEEERVIERKTSARMVKAVKPEWRLQGRLYRLATNKPVEWHVSAKTKDPSVYTADEMPGLRLPLSPRQDEATVAIVQMVATEIIANWHLYGPHQPWPDALNTDSCGWCGWGPGGNRTCWWWAD